VTSLQTKDERFAALAAALARASGRREVAPTDVLRVLRHELRRRNTNRALQAPYRSRRAHEVLERAAAAGEPVPKNSSPDALHSDHVHPLSERDLLELTTMTAWLERLAHLDTVVCVTAAENHALQQVERTGTSGWPKYAAAGVEIFEVASGPLHGPSQTSRSCDVPPVPPSAAPATPAGEQEARHA
jgi:hypothetical protein